jgi:hypothetical protein
MDSRSDLWAITAYFNPIHYRRLLSNYRIFRRHLNLPLVVVELGYDGQFDLGPDDAEILVQLPGKAVLWQKERLLNLALARVPAECGKVVWLDSDILFEKPDWAAAASGVLEQFPLVQVFAGMVDLPRDHGSGVPEVPAEIIGSPSSAFGLHQGIPVRDLVTDTWRRRQMAPSERRVNSSPGYGWAFRRALYAERGFYDVDIVGGGARLQFCAALGACEELMDERQLNPRQREYVRRWVTPFHEEVQGRIGYVPGRIFHLWHGDRNNRGYPMRHQDLVPFQFDPFEDIALDEHGCWRWNTAKPALHEHVRRHFLSRRDDG